MTFADFTPAGILLAAELNEDLRRVAPLWADKLVDETINNNATLQDDDDLIIPVEANTTYWCMLDATVLSGATPDWKCDFVAPAAATLTNWKFLQSTGVGAAYGICGASGSLGISTAGVDVGVNIWGRLVTSSTAGNLRLRWAQNTANASDTTVRAGSSLWAFQMGFS